MGPAGRLSYLFSTPSPLFYIDDSGDVYTKSALSDGVYNLTVIAADSGSPERSATVMLIITVKETNNSTLKFEKSSYRFTVKEEGELRTKVGEVSVKDGESGARITYNINSDDFVPFTIDGSNGTIFTTKVLDREVQSTFLFSVEAVDNSEPPNSATTDVFVQVVDINDNYPVFQNSSYKVAKI